MTAQLIDRRALKAETRETLAEAQVSPKAFTALYLALVLAMNLVDSFTGIGMLATFVSILITLLALVLEAGFVLYCMAVRQGERAEFLCLLYTSHMFKTGKQLVKDKMAADKAAAEAKKAAQEQKEAVNK